jgi:hypothetical protein
VNKIITINLNTVRTYVQRQAPERNVRNRGHRRTSPEREDDEMSESLHSALVESLFDEEEALLNLHMNVIQGEFRGIW